jgi:hypothetical protein
MKLSDKQMGMLTRSEVLSKYYRCFYLSIWKLFFCLGKTIYNARLKTIPPFPRDITFDIPPQFRTTSSGNDFLLYDHLYSRNSKRILIFSSEFLMKKMCSSSLLSMDGTFSVVPKIFKQLYIIIAIHEVTHSGEFLFVIL